MKKTKIVPKIRALAKKTEQVKEQQKRLGLFCHDRELLSCPGCGLEEDVTFEGLLIVTNRTNRDVDTGLRFSEVDVEKGRYRCPGCGRGKSDRAGRGIVCLARKGI